ncbi:MAG: hypothetical protein ABI167_00820 [Nitrosospira sp.]
MDPYSKILAALDEIDIITKMLPQVEKPSMLEELAARIKSLSEDAQDSAKIQEHDRRCLIKEVWMLREELARLK